jgi:hypothetical protein
MAKRHKSNGSDAAREKEIAEAILQLCEPDGSISPAAVVEAARSVDSVLHDEFEWRGEKNGKAT